MDVIRLGADPKCSSNLVNSITTIDSLLKVRAMRVPLKKLFGLGELKSDQDFVSVLTVRLSFHLSSGGFRSWRRSGWASRMWMSLSYSTLVCDSIH